MKVNLIKGGAFLAPYSQEDEEKLNKLSNAIYSVDLKNMDSRTLAQNKALHLWCNQIAQKLNHEGLFMQGIFCSDVEWNMELVKTQIVKKIAKKIFNTSSTTKLKRKEIDELVDYVTIAFSTKGIEIPYFPNKEIWNKKENKCTTK